MTSPIQLQAFAHRTTVPASRESQLVYVMIVSTAQDVLSAFTMPHIHLCLVLDRSSSMRNERLYYVKEAAQNIIDQMHPHDSLSVITFHDHAQVIIPSQAVGNTNHLKYLINDIEATGGTEIAQGLDMAYQEMKQTLPLHDIHHIILLTDGHTYGDEQRCLEIARYLKTHNIGLTTLGVGEGWNEDFLEALSATENSTTHYITHAQGISATFTNELKRMHSILAQKVQLLITGHTQCIVRSLDRVQPYIAPINLKRERYIHWVGNLGNWAGIESHAFLAEIVVPPLDAGRYPLLHMTLRYTLPGTTQQQHNDVSLEIDVCRSSDVSSDIDMTIRYWLERLTAYRLQVRAWQHVETGNINQAIQELTIASTRLVAVGDTDLASTIRQEIKRLRSSGRPSSEGRKRIKYGTRGLLKSV